MAAYAKANHIPVAVWELANEPYLYTSSSSRCADYVAQMKLFRDAIKAADPNAVVAIFSHGRRRHQFESGLEPIDRELFKPILRGTR